MPKKKASHGGARPAVREDDGRLTDDPKRMITVSIAGSVADRLDAIGGNRSGNVEQLLVEAMDARDRKAARAKK